MDRKPKSSRPRETIGDLRRRYTDQLVRNDYLHGELHKARMHQAASQRQAQAIAAMLRAVATFVESGLPPAHIDEDEVPF